jgi:hypothetical protein
MPFVDCTFRYAYIYLPRVLLCSRRQLQDDMSDKDTVILPVVASSENRNRAVTAAYHSSSFWKRFTVGNTGASAENQMKRAMQSRHLTMIGE